MRHNPMFIGSRGIGQVVEAGWRREAGRAGAWGGGLGLSLLIHYYLDLY